MIVPEKMRSGMGSLSEREIIEMDIIKNLIQSYFDIVRKNFLDLVPKTIMHFLVNNFRTSLQNELVTQLYKEQLMSDLMREVQSIRVVSQYALPFIMLYTFNYDLFNEYIVCSLLSFSFLHLYFVVQLFWYHFIITLVRYFS